MTTEELLTSILRQEHILYKAEQTKNTLKRLLYVKLKPKFTDTDIHILTRFKLWTTMKTQKSSIYQKFDDSPTLRKFMFENWLFARDGTYSIIKYLYYGLENENAETVKKFELLPEESKKLLTSVLEEAILLNINNFTNSW